MGCFMTRPADIGILHHMFRMDAAMTMLTRDRSFVRLLMAEHAGDIAVLASAPCQDIRGFPVTCNTILRRDIVGIRDLRRGMGTMALAT